MNLPRRRSQRGGEILTPDSPFSLFFAVRDVADGEVIGGFEGWRIIAEE